MPTGRGRAQVVMNSDRKSQTSRTSRDKTERDAPVQWLTIRKKQAEGREGRNDGGDRRSYRTNKVAGGVKRSVQIGE